MIEQLKNQVPVNSNKILTSWREIFKVIKAHGPKNPPPSSPRVLWESPYYVFSKDAILGSVPSISSEVLAYMQAGWQTDKNNMCTIVVAIIEFSIRAGVDLSLRIRFWWNYTKKLEQIIKLHWVDFGASFLCWKHWILKWSVVAPVSYYFEKCLP